MDKIGIKKRKIWEVLVEKSKKKLRKKPKFNKHTVFNNRTGWIFSPKIINIRYLISTSGLDFGPKKLSVHCTIDLLKNHRFNSAIGNSFFVAPKMQPYPKNSKILLQRRVRT